MLLFGLLSWKLLSAWGQGAQWSQSARVGAASPAAFLRLLYVQTEGHQAPSAGHQAPPCWLGESSAFLLCVVHAHIIVKLLARGVLPQVGASTLQVGARAMCMSGWLYATPLREAK